MAAPREVQQEQSQPSRSRPRSRRSASGIWIQGLLATGFATLLNLMVYFVGSLLVPTGLLIMAGPDRPLMPLPWFAVAILTIIPMLVGTGIFHLLNRFVPPYAKLLFIIGVVLLVGLSIAAPLNMASGVTTQRILSIMHIIPGLLLLWALLR